MEQLPARRDQITTIRKALQSPAFVDQVRAALPRHVSAERLLRIFMTAVRQNPKLLNCTIESLMACAMACAQLGLDPEPVLGQAYIVPYGTTATFITGYRGYITLARQTGEVQTVTAQIVYAKDFFEVEYGDDEHLTHKPYLPKEPLDPDRGKMVGSYVFLRYKDKTASFDWMPKADIDKIRERSKAKDSGPWVTDYNEMAKKTVIRRHAKLVPLSVELAKAAAIEERGLMGYSPAEFVFPDALPEMSGSPTPDLATYNALVDEHIGDDKARRDRLEEYMTLNAQNSKEPIELTKASAARQWDAMFALFERWEANQSATQGAADAMELAHEIKSRRHTGLKELIKEAVANGWKDWTPALKRELVEKCANLKEPFSVVEYVESLRKAETTEPEPEPTTEPEPSLNTEPPKSEAHYQAELLVKPLSELFAKSDLTWPDVDAYLTAHDMSLENADDRLSCLQTWWDARSDELGWSGIVGGIKAWLEKHKAVNGGTVARQ